MVAAMASLGGILWRLREPSEAQLSVRYRCGPSRTMKLLISCSVRKYSLMPFHLSALSVLAPRHSESDMGSTVGVAWFLTRGPRDRERLYLYFNRETCLTDPNRRPGIRSQRARVDSNGSGPHRYSAQYPSTSKTRGAWSENSSIPSSCFLVDCSLPIRLSPTPTICSVSPWTAGKGRRRRIEEAIRLILDCSENRTGV